MSICSSATSEVPSLDEAEALSSGDSSCSDSEDKTGATCHDPVRGKWCVQPNSKVGHLSSLRICDFYVPLCKAGDPFAFMHEDQGSGVAALFANEACLYNASMQFASRRTRANVTFDSSVGVRSIPVAPMLSVARCSCRRGWRISGARASSSRSAACESRRRRELLAGVNAPRAMAPALPALPTPIAPPP